MLVFIHDQTQLVFAKLVAWATPCQDILFFWVARMVMMGLTLTDKAPLQWAASGENRR